MLACEKAFPLYRETQAVSPHLRTSHAVYPLALLDLQDQQGLHYL